MKVAVIGSGVSGLAATWLLNEHSDHEVHLYEADSRVGGHANTVRFVPPSEQDPSSRGGVDVDTGFIVFNPSTYPNFLRFLQRPTALAAGIRILPTEMTFSVSENQGEFEWAGKNPATVFCQPWRLLDPRMWRMVYDIFRFNVCARRIIYEHTPGHESESMSIGDYLAREGYSKAFQDYYLIPMTAAIWSTPRDKCFLDFPALTLIRFLYNHHLLQVIGKPSWLTLQGGSRTYVNAIIDKLPKQQLHISTPIISLRTAGVDATTSPRRVILTTAFGKEESFDHVILACHSDTALDILRRGNIDPEEDRILSMFDWNRNEVVLHSDTQLMPQRRAAWSCWNYLSYKNTEAHPEALPKNENVGDGNVAESTGLSIKSASPTNLPTRSVPSVLKVTAMNQVSLTYYMNDLQHISEDRFGPVLATLNPPFQPARDKVVGRWRYDHPIIDGKAVTAQNEMYKIQNQRSISFAGAYLKYGFHEDGFTSGLLAACALDYPSGGFPSQFGTEDLSATTEDVDMSIPTPNLTVRPPFEIRHPDRHIRLSQKKSENFAYEMAAFTFSWLEQSGVRSVIGHCASIILFVLGSLLRIPKTGQRLHEKKKPE